jgi:UDP-N-acetylglucosamine enolpyruvyl transferase
MPLHGGRTPAVVRAREPQLKREDEMALSGSGAMVLYHDIAPAAIEGHDDWHTHEHSGIPARIENPTRNFVVIMKDGKISKNLAR